MVPQPFSLRLLCAKHRWMAVSKAAVVHFQRILSYFGPNDSLLQRIIRGEKPGEDCSTSEMVSSATASGAIPDTKHVC